MNTIIRAGWLSGMLICMTGLLSAQKSSVNEELIKADRQYALYAYNLAMQTYQQVLKDDPNNAHALARIGDCHYQLDHPEKSIEWYQRAIRQNNMSPDVFLRYGKALMQTGNYEEANDQFLAYAEKDETVGNHYAKACDYAIKAIKKESGWLLKNEPLNTDYADFAPTFLGSRVVYNSSRTDLMPKAKNADAPSGSQNFLLVTQQNPESGLLQKPQLLRSELQNARNEGPVSFSADGSRVAFCRNNFINGTRQIAETGINMSMYTADVDENGKWTNIKAFPYNGSNYATGFPSMSADGNTLVFSSTQPGGFGGWDIYVSNFRDGAWSTPRNLGSPLNTPGNEVTPYFDGESLYFSSDWHLGLGGLDVFRAELGPETVSDVLHLGSGINTPRDDYGFVFDKNDNIGYLTSTRDGGRGHEDIWKVTKRFDNEVSTADRKKSPSEEPYKPSEYNTEEAGDHHMLVTDERGNEIANAEIDLTDCYGEKGYTDMDGKFQFVELTKAIDCQVSIRKKGFREAVINLKKFGKQNVRVALTPETRQQYTGRVYDANSKAALRGVNVVVEFNDGSKQIETETDEDGYYALYLEPGSYQMVNFSKYGYVDQISRIYFDEEKNSVPSVTMEKSGYKKEDDYVDYRSDKPAEYNTDDEPKTTTILRKQNSDEQAKGAGQVAKFNGYSIQLAAMPEAPTDQKLGTYESLTKDGNLYVKEENKYHKIRLGIYPTKQEAEAIWKKVVANKANKGAFIVEERGLGDDLIIGAKTVAPKPVEHTTDLEPQTKKIVPVLYAIQLGSFSNEKSINIGDYANLRGLGNLYSHSENGYTQVRLGIWENYDVAKKTKETVLDRGFSKATIVTEQGDDPDIQEFIEPGASKTEAKKVKILGEKGARPQTYSTEETTEVEKPYYIRLAALSNPDRFDGSKLEDLGTIEKRAAPFSTGMTIVLLGNYVSLEAAEEVLAKVVKRGYKEAYVMKDEKGKMTRN
ncbi:MAG: carboxypeptidase regulatory-like domain-containing protein [Saprospiraceae bacterium]|nr:carboxypeptidase regulatory-like domain-containing protein [Saprospiraceae bacterium]